MRIQEWEFIEERRIGEQVLPPHPVYAGRAAGETRWPVPLSQMHPRAYTPPQPPGAPVPRPTREPLLMEMLGHPSVDIHVSPEGHTVQTVRLASQYTQNIRIDQIERLAYQWHSALQRLSRGPLTSDDLREMGHPYGYQHARTAKGYVKPTFGTLRKPRTIPGYVGRYRTGARGFVGNRAVINIQSGKLERSWRYSVLRWSGGITLNFWNTAKTERGVNYPWFLAHGTIFMQAHGPWPFVAEQLLPQIQDEWRQGAADAARSADLDEGLYGAAAVAAQDRIAEAGGFS